MERGKRRLPFRYIEPAFFAGLLDDPLLFLRIRPLGKALLFDCGQIAHLAKRVVKPIDTVFITHAHMDHIMGIPTLVRHHHSSPRPLSIYGPPGVGERVYHLLHGFDWNLTAPTWFTLHVHEVHPDRLVHYRFPGPEGFRRYFCEEVPRNDHTIWSCRYVTVEAELLDHKLPALSFRITERPHFTVDAARLAALGLTPGNWIRDLKCRVWKGQTDKNVFASFADGADPGNVRSYSPEKLYDAIQGKQQSASIGYLCDVGWTGANIATINSFLGGLTLLCAECTFLAADMDKARASHHLATTDLNELATMLAPRYLLPMHLSKSYLHRTVDLYAEIRPPTGTTLLSLPNHLVPAPLTTDQVNNWLRPPEFTAG